MSHDDVPSMLGVVLSSTKYGVQQSRGKFGLGVGFASCSFFNLFCLARCVAFFIVSAHHSLITSRNVHVRVCRLKWRSFGGKRAPASH
jgi:hypothetical protein